jgi:Zn-dependent peptidase ImmA (M78 family)
LEIKIGWKKYTVVELDIDDSLIVGGDACYGKIDYVSSIIYLNSANTPSQSKSTLLHEVIHGVEDMYGVELSEEQVTTVANGLYAFMLDNKDLVRDLICE